MKYSQKLADKIVELVASGEHTIKNVCKHVGISFETYNTWKKTKPEFSDLLKEAERERLDNLGELARSGLALLLEKHEYEEVTTEYVDNGKGQPKVKARKVVKKFVMPNPTAVIFTLKNRAPESWRDKQDIEHSGNIAIYVDEEDSQLGSV